MGHRSRLVLKYVLLACAAAGLFALRTFRPEAHELVNATPAAANRLTYGDIHVPHDADSVYVSRGYYPPKIVLRFHATGQQIDAWVHERLATARFREVPVPRDPDPGIWWFNTGEIRHGAAFVEDVADTPQRIIVDYDRCLLFYSD